MLASTNGDTPPLLEKDHEPLVPDLLFLRSREIYVEPLRAKFAKLILIASPGTTSVSRPAEFVVNREAEKNEKKGKKHAACLVRTKKDGQKGKVERPRTRRVSEDRSISRHRSTGVCPGSERVSILTVSADADRYLIRKATRSRNDTRAEIPCGCK